MGRKERCPRCGSKKIRVRGDSKECRVCGYEWTGRVRRKAPRKEKVRF